MRQQVLIVEDESIVALDLQSRLTTLGFTVVGIAKSGDVALRYAHERKPDIVLMDIQLTGSLDGIETARRLRETLQIPVVFLTAYSDQESIDRAKASDAFGYLLKPFQERELIIAIELAIYKFAVEQERRRNRLILDTTLNGINDGIISTDQDECILFANTASEQMLGISGNDLRGRPLKEIVRLIPIDDGEGYTRAGDSWFYLDRPDGIRLEVEVKQYTISSKGPGPTGITVLQDVSVWRRYRRTLVESRNAAEAAARAKSVFISKMSHELRTPLNGIMGMADLTLEEGVSDIVREYVGILRESTANLVGLVDDILQSAQAESDVAQSESFSPENLIETVVRGHAFEVHRRGIRLILRSDPTLPKVLSADPRMIGRILEKLLSNAIKFTSSGHIEVQTTYLEPNTSGELTGEDVHTIFPCPTETTAPRVNLAVSDTGMGIPPGKRDEIFGGFVKLDEGLNRQTEGAGLGLAIVRQLAESLGAGLGFTSDGVSGTTFYVEIPVWPIDDERISIVPEVQESSTIAEIMYTDDRLIARAFEPHLRNYGVELVLSTPAQIVELVDAASDPDRVRVVLSAVGVAEIAETAGFEGRSESNPLVSVETFAENGDRFSDIGGLARFKEPLTASTIRKIIASAWDTSDRTASQTTQNGLAQLRSDVDRIVGAERHLVGPRLRELRDSTTDHDLKEILFRLSIAYQRGDTERVERIRGQLLHYLPRR